MIQRGKNASFPFESRNAIPITSERFGKKLNGHTSTQLRVRGLIHVTHPTRTEVRGDFVVGDSRSNHGANLTRASADGLHNVFSIRELVGNPNDDRRIRG